LILQNKYFSLIIFLLFSCVKDFYAQDTIFYVYDIEISGNNITRERIILRELTFSKGDSISSENISNHLIISRDNLLKTALFNFVNIDYTITSDYNLIIFISLVERWYIWPVPLFEHAERNLGAFLKNPDWNKINYGLQLNWNNFRGRKEMLIFRARLGYKEQYSLFFDKSNFGKKQKFGISAGVNAFRMHEVHATNYDNKPFYINSEDHYLFEDITPSLKLLYRNHLYITHSLMLLYTNFSFMDSVYHMDYLGVPYGQKARFYRLEYMVECDYRNSKYYPLYGKYLRVTLKQRGLGIIPEYNQRRPSLLIYTSYHKKWNDRWYHNQAARIYISPDKREPGYYRTGIGYIPYLRGYELYTIEGTSSFILLNNLKYCLLPEKTFTIPSLPWYQFNKTHLSIYANIFVDAGYARGNYTDPGNNTFVNNWLYSTGIGFDLVTYYDQVLRLETSINHLGKFGFFVHTEVPFKRW